MFKIRFRRFGAGGDTFFAQVHDFKLFFEDIYNIHHKIQSPHSNILFYFSGPALAKHIAEIHKLVAYVCEVCGSILKSQWWLRDHKIAVHGKEKNFKCQICNKAFALNTMLKAHIKNAHDQVPTGFKCDFCDFR